MSRFFRFAALLLSILGLTACNNKSKVDLVLYNGVVYTVDSAFSVVQAMAVNDGKIVATGSTDEILARYSGTETIDANGKFVYPGFIDAHCHFLAYGRGLNECDLVGSKSWEDVLERLKSFAATHPDGWLVGRGWDQNDWPIQQYPTNDSLNVLFGNRPVFLSRVDGHAAIVNDTLIKALKITNKTNILGGDILTVNGKPSGVLIDNAVSLVEAIIPARTAALLSSDLLAAQKNCFAVGLTGVHDCGLNAADVLLIDSLQKAGSLQMRMNVLLSDEKSNYDWAFTHGKIRNEKLNVGSFKLYADGALGSRGACLIAPYADQPGHYGFLLRKLSYYDSILPVIAKNGWQACTHAIGDSGNRAILTRYAKYMPAGDSRWRIEHAQVVAPADFQLFGKFSIVPSVQPTHATSDMYWAGERLGEERLKTAYAYKQLLNQNGWIPLGTDFPVEHISPIKTFYAAVVRKDEKGYPADGFQKENALSAEQAIRGMTIWAAKAAFEEKEKGSLEKGKYADFIILDQSLLSAAPAIIPATKVLMTVLGGKQVFKAAF